MELDSGEPVIRLQADDPDAGLVRVTQNAECEFIGELAPDAIKPALDILRVRRFMVTKGVSRSFDWKPKRGGAGSVESLGGPFQGETYPPDLGERNLERRTAFPKSVVLAKVAEVLPSGLRCGPYLPSNPKGEWYDEPDLARERKALQCR